ncbi:hypothetical protein VNI00_007577 [Paramarasmius palmivorus]|uniref:Uncharacterized protein n=1 Tax=Paramarasmius palmivorus TaxID=297713 RepID=A0AAW0D1W3_9AGAR
MVNSPEVDSVENILNTALVAVVGLLNTHLRAGIVLNNDTREALTAALRSLALLLNGQPEATGPASLISADASATEASEPDDLADLPEDLVRPPGLTAPERPARNPWAICVAHLMPNCQECNPSTAPERWYSVTAGLRVGWVKGIDLAKDLTYGITDNEWKYHPSERLARAAFLEQYKARKHRVLGLSNQVSARSLRYEPLGAGLGWVTP